VRAPGQVSPIPATTRGRPARETTTGLRGQLMAGPAQQPDTTSSLRPRVQRIFHDYCSGCGLFAIAESLTRDGIPSPSAHDPARNRHRCGLAWSKGAVRAILSNPRYTGRQVWNKQRKEEILLDVDNVAFGYETRLRWNQPDAWIWSTGTAHQPLIDAETFEHAQGLLAGKGAGRALPRAAAHQPSVHRARAAALRDLRVAHAGPAQPRCPVLPLPLPQRIRARPQGLPPAQRLPGRAGPDPPLDAWLAEPSPRTASTTPSPAHARGPARPRPRAGGRGRPTRDHRMRRQDRPLPRSPGNGHRPAEPQDRADVYQNVGLRLTYEPGKQLVRAEARLDPHKLEIRSVSEGGLEPPRPIKGTSTSS
jgi:hypothetical protein